jgi:undecaprenyl-diphosphatase
MLTYMQAAMMGLLQGVTELFPVSSLGHSVLLPSLLGWSNLVQAQSDTESFFLAFLVGLHLATAIALVLFYRGEWLRIVRGFFRSLSRLKIESPDERLAWLLVAATIPTGLIALIFEHQIRVIFARPSFAAIFLFVNGFILIAGELFARKKPVAVEDEGLEDTEVSLEKVRYGDAAAIGVIQTAALLPGISRSGITLVGGLVRGLGHRTAARFSFLMATPIILLAGLYKIPDLIGPNGNGVRLQILVGSLVAGVAAYLSIRFLDRYFKNRKAWPYAVYCLIAGGALTLKFLVLR